MALAGRPAEPPAGPPEGLLEGIDRLALPFPGLDALALLGERATLMGLWRRGSTSCGGSCRLLPCAGEFLAVSLPRDDDMEMVAAWLELDPAPASAPAVWSAVAAHLGRDDPRRLTERARLLGLPVARLGEAAGPAGRSAVLPTRLGDASPRPDLREVVVVDLSALWAGPLCGDLLATRWGHRGQGGVDATPRRRPPRQPRLLRPPQRAQAIGRPRPAEQERRPRAARPGAEGGHRD